MSLILDALNRSRGDSDPVPGLATHHPVESLEPERRQYLPWIALAIALVLIAWLIFERFAAPPESAADIGAPVAELSRNIDSAVTAVTTELKARAAESEKMSQEGLTQKPAPKVAIEPAADPVVNRPEQVPPVAKKKPVPTPVVPAAKNTAIARLYEQRDEIEESPPVSSKPLSDRGPAQQESISSASRDEPLDIEEILRRAQEESEKASLEDHPVPFLSSLSQQTKDEIPTLYYQRHDYSSNPSQSEVVLNGKAVRVGGSPLSGMKVEEILPDSVVLSYKGTQFRLNALNSWVNL